VPERVPAVVVDHVSKSFRMPHERVHTLKERALHPFRRTGSDVLHALRDVSFSVAPGEFLGIVGRNGSGKSTLLKCLAGIYSVGSGAIYVDGRVATFIELGVGFNPDLPAADNILLNAVMLGLSPADARERVETVLDFAELHEFRELKLKNYSSGMQVRLAFSVMLQVEADVLLIDELLAVGDAAFQQKCYDQFNRLRDEGRTILFVTHDMAAVTRFCHRAMLLEEGKMVSIGAPKEVSREYIALNFPEQPQVVGDVDIGVLGDRAAYVLEAWFEDEEGNRREHIPNGERCRARALISFKDEMLDPSFGVTITDEKNTSVFATSTVWTNERTGRFAPGERVVFGVDFQNVLAPGRYHARIDIAARGTGRLLIDQRDRAATMVSTGAQTEPGLLQLPHETSVKRLAADPAEPPVMPEEARS
jgi:ABC-type polysaccharide/polyol phosphate transport system ATPase subunit